MTNRHSEIRHNCGLEFLERHRAPLDRRAFSPDDALFMLEYPALKFASTMPERHWAGIAMCLERAKVRLGQPSPSKHVPAIRRALGLSAIRAAERIAWKSAAGRTEHHIQVMKVMSARGWAPSIQLEGEEYLKAALRRGKGAILWVAHFCFNTQVTKMALKAGGYRVAHMSRPEHGFSKSLFGIRHLNPLRWNAELKYLERRILIDRANPGGSLREAKTVLEDNNVVSITAGAWEGRKVARGPLLGGHFTLATGAPYLAELTGAALLPVITTRMISSEVFRVKIGAPLTTTSEDRFGAIQGATNSFLTELEVAVKETPDQWRGWNYLEFG